MKKQKEVLVSGPSITSKEVKYVARAAREAWDYGAYKFVSEFERKFAKYIGVKYALATSSCTGALHLALLSLGIGKGDEVIVPDIIWIASVAPITYVGARPVFVDIDPVTWCIDTKKIEEKLTKRTKAIMPVHLYGHPADMRKIIFLAAKYKLFVIEDAAESLGATYYGRKTGSMGDAGVFSFHGSKMLVTGEGGMLVTNSRKLYERARFLNSHANNPAKLFWNTEIGYKYKMSDLQAALGIAQLSRLGELLKKKRQIFSWYRNRLADFPGVRLNVQKPGCKNSYWMTTFVWDKKFKVKKGAVLKRLLNLGIHARPFFYPLTTLPPFRQKVRHSVSYTVSPYAINLPCGLNLKEKEAELVSKALLKVLKLNNVQNPAD